MRNKQSSIIRLANKLHNFRFILLRLLYSRIHIIFSFHQRERLESETFSLAISDPVFWFRRSQILSTQIFAATCVSNQKLSKSPPKIFSLAPESKSTCGCFNVLNETEQVNVQRVIARRKKNERRKNERVSRRSLILFGLASGALSRNFSADWDRGNICAKNKKWLDIHLSKAAIN